MIKTIFRYNPEVIIVCSFENGNIIQYQQTYSLSPAQVDNLLEDKTCVGVWHIKHKS